MGKRSRSSSNRVFSQSDGQWHEEPSEDREPEPLPRESDIKRWHAKLLETTHLLKYWTDERRLSLETVKSAQIGWDIQRRCYTLPIRVDGKIVNLTRRYPNGGKSVNLAGRTNKVWFGLGTTKRPGPLLICAGEPDALTAFELGYAAATLCSGESSRIDEELARQLPAGRDLVLLYDCDDGGRDAAPRRAAELFPYGNVRVVDLRVDELSEGLTDLNDYWAKHEPRPTADEVRAMLNEAIAAAQPWITEDAGKVARRRLHDRPYWLRWARERWRQYGRNKTGYMLARELQSDAYPEDEAWEVVSAYQAEVERERYPRYSESEARKSLRSAYSRPPSWHRGHGRGYRLNDTGHAQRLVDAHGGDFLFAMHGSAEPELYMWTGRVWQAVHKSALYDWVSGLAMLLEEEAEQIEDEKTAARWLQQATSLGNTSTIGRVIGRAMGDAAVRLERPDRTFNGNKAVVNLLNGALVLGENGVSFREHRREDYCTQIANVEWEETAGTPRWGKFITHLFPDKEVREYVQRALAYCVYGGNTEQLLFFLIGAPSTGKSQLALAILKLLGDYAGPFKLSMFRAKQDEAPRADIVRAMPRRLIFAVESSPQWVLHGDEIKRATGGDTESARNPHSAQIREGVPAYTPFIVANQAPRIHGVDRALWRRLVAIPTTKHAIKDEDVVDSLGERLAEEEGSGILNWLAAGWRRYREIGLAQPPAVQQATTYLRQLLSLEDQYIADCCVAEKKARTPFADLYLAYRQWCEAGDINTRTDGRLTKNEFATALTARGYVGKRVKLKPGSDTKTDVRVGLRLNEEAATTVRRVRGGRDSGPR